MPGAVYVKLLSEALDAGDVERALIAVTGVLSLLTTLAQTGREPDGAKSRAPHGADELLDVHEAARRLATTTDWLYRHAAELPFTRRLGRQLRFSAHGIAAWAARKTDL